MSSSNPGFLKGSKKTSRESNSDFLAFILDPYHKLSIRLSELKTNIETMKVDLTTSILYLVFFSVGSLIGLDWLLKLAGTARNRDK
jgi:hypothetical protein